jgi:hypothetical protein
MLKLAWLMPSNDFTLPLSEMSKIGIIVNCVLMVLNLVPLPPLDGGRIAVSLLPHSIWPGNLPRSSPGAFPILLVTFVHRYSRCRHEPAGRAFAARAIESIFGLLLDRSMYAERVLSGMRPTGVPSPGPLPRRSQELGQAPARVPVPVLRCRLARPDDALRQPARYRAGVAGIWLSTGWRPVSIPIRRRCSSSRKVPEHAELHLLMSMMTPLGWLERVPTYKDQQEKLEPARISQPTVFLATRCLMSADILIYRADKVPVGEDQLPHVEFTRELARRFNHMYGREPGFEDKAREAVKKLGSKKARLYEELRTRFQQNGDKEAIEQAHAMLDEIQHLSVGDRERLVRLSRRHRQDDSCRAECAAHRGVEDAWAGWSQDVQVLQQHNYTPRIR